MFTKKIMLPRKIQTACIFFLAVSFTGLAQTNVIQSSGNVGIGTTTPASPLHVRGNAIFQRSGGGNFLIAHSNVNGVYLTSDDPGTNQKNLFISASPTGPNSSDRSIVLRTGKSNGTLLSRMVISGNGNVGIGTTSPTHRLQVAGSSKWTGNSSSYTEIHSNGSGQYLRQFANDGKTQSWLIRGYATSGVQAIFNRGGINVNGTVKAKEVNITSSIWPDYVFRPDYKLMPLKEVEAFILEYGHLPNIPSEAEVTENGIQLGELNASLLRKIEELTLYVISQEQKINALVTRLEQIEDRK